MTLDGQHGRYVAEHGVGRITLTRGPVLNALNGRPHRREVPRGGPHGHPPCHKRFLHASFHADPRALVDEVVRAQVECLGAPEMAEADRAWDERREARFFPPPARS